MCKNEGVKGYSQLNKQDLVKLIRKNIKSGGYKTSGNEGITRSKNNNNFWMAYYHSVNERRGITSKTYNTIHVHSKIGDVEWKKLLDEKTTLDDKAKTKILTHLSRYRVITINTNEYTKILYTTATTSYLPFYDYVPYGIKYKGVDYTIDDTDFWIKYFIVYLVDLLITPLNNKKTNNSRTNTSSINTSGTNNY
jgi:hypothetical protein